MLEIRLLKPSDYQEKPWLNGSGKTNEIAVDRAHDPFRWRVSWAALPDSSPFSTYPGYSRIFVLINGGPVTLIQKENKKRMLRKMEPFSFDGDGETRAVVGAPAEDLNVFALRDRARCSAYPTYFGKNEDMQFPIAGQEHFIFCVDGSIQVFDPNTDQKFTLEPKSTLQISRNTKREFLNVRAKGSSDRASCLWIVVHLQDPL
jgi:environmental stress-induced protein Ves